MENNQGQNCSNLDQSVSGATRNFGKLSEIEDSNLIRLAPIEYSNENLQNIQNITRNSKMLLEIVQNDQIKS